MEKLKLKKLIREELQNILNKGILKEESFKRHKLSINIYDSLITKIDRSYDEMLKYTGDTYIAEGFKKILNRLEKLKNFHETQTKLDIIQEKYSQLKIRFYENFRDDMTYNIEITLRGEKQDKILYKSNHPLSQWVGLDVVKKTLKDNDFDINGLKL